MIRVAILDDYQNAAMAMADWSGLQTSAEVVTFHDHLFDQDALAQRLADFDVVVGMRERTGFSQSLLERLPKLKLLITTGMNNASFDVVAATQLGIIVSGTASGGGPGTTELTWALILALLRRIPLEDKATREGQWEVTVGEGLAGKTLGVIGLGNIGTQVANIGKAFQMPVLTWSQNLTKERAEQVGAVLVSKDELLRRSDIVTIHVRLSERTRGLIGANELRLMKPTAYLLNTSRGPIVNEAALVEALQNNRIAGAGLDVFDTEPLPKNHPYLELGNTVLTPHLGYVTLDGYQAMFSDAIENIETFLRDQPVRVINPSVLAQPNLRRIT